MKYDGLRVKVESNVMGRSRRVLFAERDDVGKIRIGFEWKSKAPQRHGDMGVTHGRFAQQFCDARVGVQRVLRF